MAQPIRWTPLADQTLIQMRADGVPWPAISVHLHVGRSAAIERARSLGMAPKQRMQPPKPRPVTPRIDRPPLPAGHPLTWGAITTGIPYPYPVFL